MTRRWGPLLVLGLLLPGTASAATIGVVAVVGSGAPTFPIDGGYQVLAATWVTFVDFSGVKIYADLTPTDTEPVPVNAYLMREIVPGADAGDIVAAASLSIATAGLHQLFSGLTLPADNYALVLSRKSGTPGVVWNATTTPGLLTFGQNAGYTGYRIACCGASIVDAFAPASSFGPPILNMVEPTIHTILFQVTAEVDVDQVPEPATSALVALGLAAIGFRAGHRRRHSVVARSSEE